MIARSVCSHREAAYKRAKNFGGESVELQSSSDRDQTTAYTSGLITVQYNVPVDEAQLGSWPSSMIHGAEVPPIIPKSLMQIAAGMDTQHKKKQLLVDQNQIEIQSHGF